MNGFTLLELLVVLAIMAVLAGVSAVAMRSPERGLPDPRVQLASARLEALEAARPVTITLSMAGRLATATAFPDGRVVADPILRIDPLTGAGQDAPLP